MAASDLAFDGYASEDDASLLTAPAHFLEHEGSNPEDLVAEEDWQDDASARLGAALAELDERSRAIVEARWLAEKKATLHELAETYGVSAERIRQIEQNAIKKLKAACMSEAA